MLASPTWRGGADAHVNRLLAVLLVWLAVLVHPSEAHASWTRMTTEHFVFVGDAAEGTIRSIAERLEMFREVISRVLSSQATSNSLPTVVIVFQNARSLAPFRPVFEGRPVELAGFFVSG